MRQVIDHVESLKEELSAQEAKDKYYQLIKRCDQPSKTRGGARRLESEVQGVSNTDIIV